MGRPKETKIHADSAVARLLTDWFNETTKLQTEIADEIGLARPNVLAMFKQGRSKLPINHVVKLATSLGKNPEELMDVVLEEYHPELKRALLLAKGRSFSKSERVLMETLRDTKKEVDAELKEEDKPNSLWKIDEQHMGKLSDYARKHLIKKK